MAGAKTSRIIFKNFLGGKEKMTKMTKRLIGLAIAVLLIVVAVPFAVLAADGEDQGNPTVVSDTLEPIGSAPEQWTMWDPAQATYTKDDTQKQIIISSTNQKGFVYFTKEAAIDGVTYQVVLDTGSSTIFGYMKALNIETGTKVVSLKLDNNANVRNPEIIVADKAVASKMTTTGTYRDPWYFVRDDGRLDKVSKVNMNVANKVTSDPVTYVRTGITEVWAGYTSIYDTTDTYPESYDLPRAITLVISTNDENSIVRYDPNGGRLRITSTSYESKPQELVALFSGDRNWAKTGHYPVKDKATFIDWDVKFSYTFNEDNTISYLHSLTAKWEEAPEYVVGGAIYNDINEAIEEAKTNNGTVELPVAETNNATIPEAVKDVAVKVEVSTGAVVFDKAASAIAAGKDVNISTDDGLVYEITLGEGEHLLNGTATVTLPVPAALEGKSVTVYYIADDGTKTAMENVTVAEGKVSFTTTHFSTYSIEEVLEIKTVEELLAFAEAVNGGDNFAGEIVKLANDIDLAGAEWTPMTSFSGTFDGNGHTISNLKFVNETNKKTTVGFFAQVNAGGSVTNLTIDGVICTFGNEIRYGTVASTLNGNVTNCHIKNVEITVSNGVFRGAGIAYTVGSGTVSVTGCTVDGFTVDDEGNAAFCGGLLGTVKSGTTVTDCHVSNVTIDVAGNIENSAGLIGKTEGVAISTSSVSNVTITGNEINRVAGFVGQATSGTTVYDCDAEIITLTAKTIKTTAGGEGGTGGFIGGMQGNNNTVEKCNIKNVTITATVSANQVGGFIGNSDYSNNKITECSADTVNLIINDTADTVNTGTCLGGFAGQTRGQNTTFDNCHVTNLNIDINGNSCGNIGGFIGNLGAQTTVSNSSATGKIDAMDASKSEDILIGGFASNLGWGQSWTNEFTKCTATVDIETKGVAGGFLGAAQTAGNGSNTEADVTINGCTASGNVTTTDGVAGGLIGIGNQATVTESKVTGTVTATGEEGTAGSFWGEVTTNTNGVNVTITGCEVENTETAEDYFGEVAEGLKVVESTDGTIGVREIIATVNGNKYVSLQDAIDAANAGDVITILDSFSELGTEVEANSGEFFVQIIDKEVVIDLNGFTFTGSLYLNSGAKLTIDNGSIVSLEGNASSCIESVGGYIILGEKFNAHSSARHAIRVKGGTAVINGGTYQTTATGNITAHALNISHASKVTINGGVFMGSKGHSTATSGNAVMIQDSESIVNIYGGDFSNAIGVEGPVSVAGGLTVYNGSFDVWYTGYDKFVTETKAVVYNEETARYSLVDAVARIEANNKSYATLADAIEAAKAGETVKLLTVVEITAADAENAINKGVVINKGGTESAAPEGYKWTADGDLAAKVYVAEVNGVAYETLAEAVAAANANDVITMIADDLAAAGIEILMKDITIDLNGFTISNKNAERKPGAIFAVNNSVLTIKDTKGTGKIIAALDLTTEENKGWVGNDPTIVSDASNTSNKGSLVIEGGSFISEGNVNGHNGYLFETYYLDYVTINGGTFNHGNQTNGLFRINSAQVITVSGGVFSTDQLKSYVGFGHKLEKQDDNMFHVVEGYDVNNWAQVADTSWFTGNETAYEISTAAQLAGLAKLVNEGNDFTGITIKIVADIDLGKYAHETYGTFENLEWTPIGGWFNHFNGTIDGANHTISNVIVNQPKLDGVGFIGAVDSGAFIKNIKLDKVTVTGRQYTAALIGYGGGKVYDCAVTNASVNGTSNVGVITGNNNSGWYINNTVDGADAVIPVDGTTVIGNDVIWEGDYEFILTGTFLKLGLSGGKDLAIIHELAVVKYNETDEIYTVYRAVCSIDGVYYATLQEAINAANEGDEIVLCGNTTEAMVTVKAGKDVVIDFNNFTLNGSMLVEKGATADIKNGKIYQTESVAGIEVRGVAILTDMDITSEGRHAIRVDGLNTEGTHLTVNSGTYTTKAPLTTSAYAVNAGEMSTVVINGGTFVGNGGEQGAFIVKSSETNVTINDCIITNGDAIVMQITSSTVIYGGNFAKWTASYDNFLAEGKVAVLNAEGTYDVVDATVQNETTGKYYATLEAAIDAANEGDIITVLVAEIELPVIKKAGLYFKAAEGGTKITNEIPNTNSDGGWRIDGTTFDGFEFTQRIGIIGKDLTIKECTFTGSSGIYYGCANGEWNVVNCTFDNKVYALQIGEGNGVVNVTGCTIKGGFNTYGCGGVNFNECIFEKGTTYNIVQTHSTMTLTDCTFSADWPKGDDGYNFVGAASNNAVVELYGDNKYEGGSLFDLTCTERGIFVVNPEKNEEGLYTAGAFYNEPAADKLAEGFKAVENEDGTFGVEAKTYVAEVNGTKYETLNDAINAITATGGTIVLLGNADCGYTAGAVIINSDIVIDLNGKDLAINGPFYVWGSVTINGEGNVTVASGSGFVAYRGGTVVLNGGTYTSEAPFIDVGVGGNTQINGGTYETPVLNIMATPGEVTKAEEVEVPAPEGYIWEGTTLVKVVAQIGDNYYATLKEAIDAAWNLTNPTIEILDDITVDVWNQVWGAKGWTVNGNDHTLTIGSVYGNMNGDFLFFEAVDLNVKDLTVIITDYGNGFDLNNGTLKNVDITGGTNSSYGVFANEGGTVTVDGCTITGFYYGVMGDNVADASDIVVKETTISGSTIPVISYAENTELTNNNISGGEISLAAGYNAYVTNATYVVTGNKLTNTDVALHVVKDLSAVTFEGNTVGEGAKLTVTDGSEGTLTIGANTWSDASAQISAPADFTVEIGADGSGTVGVKTAWTGSGTEADPYVIYDVEGLVELADRVNAGETFEGCYFELANNIDLAGTPWAGIGIYSETTVGTAFSGTFDGQNNKISGVTFENTGSNKYRGFFNQLYKATVKNVTIETNGFGYTADQIGSMPASMGGAVIAGHAIASTIENCVAEGTFVGSHNVAGIAVLIQGSTIKNCTNKADLTGSYSKLGGIVNFSQHKGVDSEYKGSLIENCVNMGTITSTARGENGVGGIIGWIGYGSYGADASAEYAVTIKGCENKGAITAAATTKVGQIVGSGESYIVDGGNNKGLTTTFGSDNNGYFAYAVVVDGVANYVSTLEAGNTYLVTAPGAKPVIKLGYNESITFITSLAAIDASGITADVEIKVTTEGNTTTYKAEVTNWIQIADTDWYNENDTEFTLTTAEELAGLAALVNGGNTFAGKTIYLGGNIDLALYAWTPIGNEDNPFKGNFDGQSNTISNLVVATGADYQGLFGKVNDNGEKANTIQNITLENVDIGKNGDKNYIGALAGQGYVVNFENCHVRGTVYVNGCQYVGGLVGGGYITANNCSVIASEKVEQNNLRAWYQVGGIIGMGHGAKLDNCTVENVHIFVRVGGFVGGFVGQTSEGTMRIVNCTLKDVDFYALDGNNEDTGYTTGLIVGNIGPNASAYVINNTVTNCTLALHDYSGTKDENGLKPFITNLTTLVGSGAKDYKVVAGTGVTLDENNEFVVSADSCQYVHDSLIAEGSKKVENKDGTYTVVSTYWTGTGTEADPYVIYDVEGLVELADRVNAGETFEGCYFELANNIDLAGTPWAGIGVYKDEAKSFKGTFDGKNFTISNVTFADASNGDVNSEANNYRGFFNQIVNATVKNLTVSGKIWATAPASTEYGGALIAGCAINSTIEGCTAKGTVNGTHNVAGIVVRVQDSNIINCINNAEITGSYSKMGGIAALVQNSGNSVLFEGCVNEGTINSTARGEDGVGGIVGWVGYPNTENVTFKDCVNKGKFIYTSTATVGQIVAESWNGGHVFVGNMGLNNGIPATGHSAMGGLNYAEILEGGMLAYVNTIEAGKTYLVTSVSDETGGIAKPVIKLAPGAWIAFDTSIGTIDASGITTVTRIIVTTEGNVTTYTAAPAVASIGDNYYATLQEAIDAANSNDKIVILADIAETGIIVAAGKVVVIDLGNYTVNGDFMVYGNATIKNGTIINTNKLVSAIENNGAESVLYVENLTIESARHAIRVDGGTATIVSGTYKTLAPAGETAHGINISSGATVVIIGGTFVGGGKNLSDSAAVASRGDGTSLTIKGGNFSGGTTYDLNAWGGSVVVEGGYFGTARMDAGEIKGGYFESEVYGVRAITGGTFKVDPAKNVVSGYASKAIAEGDYAGWFEIVPAVASIGEQGYATLQSAIDAAKDGEKITLLLSVNIDATLVVDKKITLDLNGNVISNEESIWNSENKDWSLISVRGGDLTIIGNGGGLEALENDVYAADVQGGKLTIEGGRYIGNWSTIYVKAGEVIINGGYFDMTQLNNAGTKEHMVNASDAEYKARDAIITINGGEFVGFNPSCNTAEGKHTVFTAEGYIGVAGEDNIYTVRPGTYAAQTSTQCFETLAEAIAAAKDGETVTLLADTTVNATIDLTKSVTIELNGKVVTLADGVRLGATGANTVLTINNGTINGKRDGVLFLIHQGATLNMDGVTATNASTDTYWGNMVQIGSDVNNSTGKATISNSTLTCASVALMVPGAKTNGTSVVLNNTELNADFGVTGKGGYLADLTVNGGSITGVTIGIYWPGGGKLTVNGDVTGATAIYVKSGTVEIKGGNISATGEKTAFEHLGSGAKATGEAIVVESCGYPNGAANVAINGGTITSAKANAIGYYVDSHNGESAETATVTKDNTVEIAAPEGYEWKDNTLVEKAIIFDIYGANIKLGSDLAMNFFVEFTKISKEDAAAGKYYAIITRTYADGRADDVLTIWSSEWDARDTMFAITYEGIKSMHMNDRLTVKIYTADGTEASTEWKDSVSDYAYRMLGKDTTSASDKALFVDMLNYGAAAQIYFNYDEENLVNSGLTEDQKKVDISGIELNNNRSNDDTYYGTSLVLDNSIAPKFYFNGITEENKDTLYAEITYTDYLGTAQKITVDGADFFCNKAKGIGAVSVDTLYVADWRQMITCTVYNADGSVYGTVTDSIESYLARMNGKDTAEGNALFEACIKFSESSYNALKK